MKLCILVLAFVAVAWSCPTGKKPEEHPAVPLVITDYSSVVKDSEVHAQRDAPQESAESNESSESEESSEVKPTPAKPVEEKPVPASIDSKSSEEQPPQVAEAPAEAPKPVVEEKKEEEPAKVEEPIKEEEVKSEETKVEMKTLANDDEEVPAPIALPTESKAEEMPENILEAASQPAAIAEDTIPLTTVKREEPAEEKEIKKPAIPLLKAEESHDEKTAEIAAESEGSSEHLRSPVAVAAEPEKKVEPVVIATAEHHEHPVVKSGEIHAEKIEAKSALPEPAPAVEEKHEIVTEEKKEEEPPKIKAEPAQEGRTVRDAVKEEAIKAEEVKPIEIEKKSEKAHEEELAIKKIEPVAEEAKPIEAESKPIVEEDKPVAEEPIAIPQQPKAVEPKQVASSEESLEDSNESKKEEKPVEEVPKPLALPSAEKTPLLKKVEPATEKKEEEAKAAELPKAVS